MPLKKHISSQVCFKHFWNALYVTKGYPPYWSCDLGFKQQNIGLLLYLSCIHISNWSCDLVLTLLKINLRLYWSCDLVFTLLKVYMRLIDLVTLCLNNLILVSFYIDLVFKLLKIDLPLFWSCDLAFKQRNIGLLL